MVNPLEISNACALYNEELSNNQKNLCSVCHDICPVNGIKVDKYRKIAVVCKHCRPPEEAPCYLACKSKGKKVMIISDSLKKQAEKEKVPLQEGVILIPKKNLESCADCSKPCIAACPYGAIFIRQIKLPSGKVKEVPTKCVLCFDKETPICISKCPSLAIYYNPTGYDLWYDIAGINFTITPPEGAVKIESRGNNFITIYHQPSSGKYYYWFNLERQPVSDIKLVKKFIEILGDYRTIPIPELQSTENIEIDYHEKKRILSGALKKYIHERYSVSDERRLDEIVNTVMDFSWGYGILRFPIRDDNNVIEIMINGISTAVEKRPMYVRTRIGNQTVTCETNIFFTNRDKLLQFINKMTPVTLSAETPTVDFRLPTGERLSADGITRVPHGPVVNIRKYIQQAYSPIWLIKQETITPEALATIWALLGANQFSTIVIGSAGSGKTTVLNVLLMLYPPFTRIITIEDSPELKIDVPNRSLYLLPGISEEDRPRIASEYISTILRKTPDLLVMGELRGGEAISFFAGVASGVARNGSLSTVHALTPQDLIQRLTSPPMNVPAVHLTAIDLVIEMAKLVDIRTMKERIFVRSICNIEKQLKGGAPALNILFKTIPRKGLVPIINPQTKAFYTEIAEMRLGMPLDKFLDEIRDRLLLIYYLLENNIVDVVGLKEHLKKFYSPTEWEKLKEHILKSLPPAIIKKINKFSIVESNE